MTLEEIKRVTEAASPGPWEWQYDQLVYYAPFTDGSTGRGSRETIIETDNGVYPPEENDRAFIAMARVALPKLIAVAEAAGKALAEADRWSKDIGRDIPRSEACTVLEQALAALEAADGP